MTLTIIDLVKVLRRGKAMQGKQYREALIGSAEQQGSIWGARAQDWADANEPTWTKVLETVLDRASVAAGVVLPDIGCGAGGADVRCRCCPRLRRMRP